MHHKSVGFVIVPGFKFGSVGSGCRSNTFVSVCFPPHIIKSFLLKIQGFSLGISQSEEPVSWIFLSIRCSFTVSKFNYLSEYSTGYSYSYQHNKHHNYGILHNRFFRKYNNNLPLLLVLNNQNHIFHNNLRI